MAISDATTAEFRVAYSLCARTHRAALKYTWHVGKVLNKVREEADHGEWLPWLRAEGLPQRTANDWMRVATLDESELADFANLTEALAHLRRNTPPDEFPLIPPHLATNFCCPNCWFGWNGDPLAGAKAEAAASPEKRRVMMEQRLGAIPLAAGTEDEEDLGMRYGIVIERAASSMVA
jgi:hypothetical protein